MKVPILLALLSTAALSSLSLPAYAATRPHVSQLVAHGPNGPQAAGTTLTYTATANGNGGTVEYQWWEDFPSGWQMVQNYSPNNTFTIPNAAAGSYPVVVYALDANQIAAGDWSQAEHQQFIANVDSQVTLNAPVNPEFPTRTPQPLQGLLLPVNNPVTVSAQATHLLDPVYQFWYQTPSGQWVGSDYSPQNTFTFTPTQSGAYRVIVYAKDPSAPNNATFSVWSATETIPISNVRPTQPVPLSQLPASLQALAPRPETNAMPPAPYAQIFALTQNNQDIGPNHPLQAGVPLIIQSVVSDGSPNLNGNEWPASLNLQQFANPYHFPHPVPATIPLFWVKPTPQSPWALLPQPDWANPPTGNQWAIAVTLADVNILSTPPSSALQLAQLSGPIVFGGEHIYTAASWNRKQTDLQFFPRIWPKLSSAGMPFSDWVTVLTQFTHGLPTQMIYLKDMNNVPSIHQTRTIAQDAGWGTNQLTGQSVAQSVLSTVPGPVLTDALSVAQQDVTTYLNNPARALWQMPPAVVQQDAAALMSLQHHLYFTSWRVVDTLSIQNQVTISPTVSHLSQPVTVSLAARQNSQGEWVLAIPLTVSSQGEQLVNGRFEPAPFSPLPAAIVVQQVPDAGAPDGVGWTVDQFIY